LISTSYAIIEPRLAVLYKIKVEVTQSLVILGNGR
jgi:hypothetical protein